MYYLQARGYRKTWPCGYRPEKMITPTDGHEMSVARVHRCLGKLWYSLISDASHTKDSQFWIKMRLEPPQKARVSRIYMVKSINPLLCAHFDLLDSTRSSGPTSTYLWNTSQLFETPSVPRCLESRTIIVDQVRDGIETRPRYEIYPVDSNENHCHRKQNEPEKEIVQKGVSWKTLVRNMLHS